MSRPDGAPATSRPDGAPATSRPDGAPAFLAWAPGDDVGALEDWPFTNPASDYRITAGSPRASGRIDAGGPGHPTRCGIWRCTAGRLDCTEQGDELFIVLDGHGRLIDHATGAVHVLAPGTTLFVRDGRRVTWDIAADLTKAFFGHRSEGF